MRLRHMPLKVMNGGLVITFIYESDIGLGFSKRSLRVKNIFLTWHIETETK